MNFVKKEIHKITKTQAGKDRPWEKKYFYNPMRRSKKEGERDDDDAIARVPCGTRCIKKGRSQSHLRF